MCFLGEDFYTVYMLSFIITRWIPIGETLGIISRLIEKRANGRKEAVTTSIRLIGMILVCWSSMWRRLA